MANNATEHFFFKSCGLRWLVHLSNFLCLPVNNISNNRGLGIEATVWQRQYVGLFLENTMSVLMTCLTSVD